LAGLLHKKTEYCQSKEVKNGVLPSRSGDDVPSYGVTWGCRVFRTQVFMVPDSQDEGRLSDTFFLDQGGSRTSAPSTLHVMVYH
jgi:hypothetical protein